MLGALYAASFFALWLLFGNQLPLWGNVLVVTIPVAVAWLLSESLKANWAELPSPLAWAVILVPLAGIVVVAWRAFTGLPTNGFGFLAFITGVVLIGQLVSALRSLLADKPGTSIYIVVVTLPVIAFVVGVLLPDSGWSLLFMVVGSVLIPIGIAVVSETLLRRPRLYRTIFSKAWFSLTGFALVVVGSLTTADWVARAFPVLPWWLIATIVGFGICVVILLISADNVVDLLLVAVLISLIAFIESAGPTPNEFDAAHDQRVLVALGDSYMSGEGVGDFYDGTNEKDSNECRRSAKAYAPMMTEVDDLPPAARFDHVIFLACSGADAVHLATVSQFPDVDPQLTQLQTILARDGSASAVGLVVLSIGGNDAGFGTLARTCVVPGDCVTQMKAVPERLPELTAYLKATYEDVRNRLADMGVRAPLVIVPYPVPIDHEGCEWSSLVFDATEHEFLNELTNQLNNAIISAAHEADIAVVEPMASAFVGDNRLAICSRILGSNPSVAKDPADVGVNLIGLGSIAGSPGQIANPQNWFHNSMHPTEAGHRAMRAVLADWLEVNDQTLTDVARSDGDVEVPPLGALDIRSQEWMYASLASFLKTHALGPALAALGAWLIALRVIGWYRYRRPERRSGGPESKQTAGV